MAPCPLYMVVAPNRYILYASLTISTVAQRLRSRLCFFAPPNFNLHKISTNPRMSGIRTATNLGRACKTSPCPQPTSPPRWDHWSQSLRSKTENIIMSLVSTLAKVAIGVALAKGASQLTQSGQSSRGTAPRQSGDPKQSGGLADMMGDLLGAGQGKTASTGSSTGGLAGTACWPEHSQAPNHQQRLCPVRH